MHKYVSDAHMYAHIACRSNQQAHSGVEDGALQFQRNSSESDVGRLKGMLRDKAFLELDLLRSK